MQIIGELHHFGLHYMANFVSAKIQTTILIGAYERSMKRIIFFIANLSLNLSVIII